jgi:hypothetical protein
MAQSVGAKSAPNEIICFDRRWEPMSDGCLLYHWNRYANPGWSEVSPPILSLNRHFIASALGAAAVLRLVSKLAVQTAAALDRKKRRRKRWLSHDRSLLKDSGGRG